MTWIVALLTRFLGSVHARRSIALVAILLGLLGGRTWLSSHDASIRVGATMAVQKRVSAEANQREQERGKSLTKILSEIHGQKQRVNTPAKAAAAIPKALPPLPEPITLTIPSREDNHSAASATDATGGEIGCTPAEGSRLLLYDNVLGSCSNLTKPEPPRPAQARAQSSMTPMAPSDAEGDKQPPAIASIPQADLKPIYDFLEDCRADQASLSAVRADLSDEREKVRVMTAERDAAIRASGKGSFWTRLSHNAKWFALGAATAATLAATKHF